MAGSEGQLDVVGQGAHLARFEQRPLHLGSGDRTPPGAETGGPLRLVFRSRTVPVSLETLSWASGYLKPHETGASYQIFANRRLMLMCCPKSKRG